jgi:TonB family protein
VLTTSPSPIQRVEPEYSDEARAAGLEGTVHVSLNIAPDGTAINEKVLSPLGLGLDEKAIECVRQWRFALPAIQTLDPVTVVVNFLLPAKLSRWHLGAHRSPYPMAPRGQSFTWFRTRSVREFRAKPLTKVG